MSDVAIGLIGVAAGAVATGSVQTAIARLDRRLEARASARVVHAVMIRARAAVTAIVQREHWQQTDSDWLGFIRRWEENNFNLARVVDAHDFFILATWFLLLEKLGQTRALAIEAGDTTPSENHLKGCRLLEDMSAQVDEILIAASRTRREMRSGKIPTMPPLREI